jgi:hypothetical protein
MTGSNSSSTVKVTGYEAKEDEDMNPDLNGVAPEFFSTLGIRLPSGRDFTEGDDLEAPRVAVVNEAFARYFFAEDDALGRRFSFGRDAAEVVIVGVAGNGKRCPSASSRNGSSTYPIRSRRISGA